MAWSDERVAVLKKMWLEGNSASEIAKELGNITRNAVIGKVHRLGLSNRDTNVSKAGVTAEKSISCLLTRIQRDRLHLSNRKTRQHLKLLCIPFPRVCAPLEQPFLLQHKQE